MRTEKMPTRFDSHILGDIIKIGQNSECRSQNPVCLGISGQYIIPRNLAMKSVREREWAWREEDSTCPRRNRQ